MDEYDAAPKNEKGAVLRRERLVSVLVAALVIAISLTRGRIRRDGAKEAAVAPR